MDRFSEGFTFANVDDSFIRAGVTTMDEDRELGAPSRERVNNRTYGK